MVSSHISEEKLHAIDYIDFDLYVCLTQLLSFTSPLDPMPSPGRSGSLATSARLEGGKFMKEICVPKAEVHKAVAKTSGLKLSFFIMYIYICAQKI